MALLVLMLRYPYPNPKGNEPERGEKKGNFPALCGLLQRELDLQVGDFLLVFAALLFRLSLRSREVGLGQLVYPEVRQLPESTKTQYDTSSSSC